MYRFAPLWRACLLLAVISTACSHDTADRGGTAYISNAESHNVTIIDTLSKTTATVDCRVLGKVNCTEPRNSAIDSHGMLLAVPFRHSNNVLLLDAQQKAFVTEVTDASFDEPYALAFTADDKEIWVANKKGGDSSVGSITIISVDTRQVVALIDDEALSSPEGISIVANKAYVANRGNGSITVIDVATRAVSKTLSVGGSPRFTIGTPDGAVVYVATDSRTVTKIATATDTVSGTISVDGNARNLAITPDGKTIFAGAGNTVQAIDVATDAVDSIAFAGGSSFYGVAVLHDGSLGLATSQSGQVYAFSPTTPFTVSTDPFYPVTAGTTPRAITAF